MKTLAYSLLTAAIFVQMTNAAEVVFDFQNFELGPITDQLLVPDGHGGLFAFVPDFTNPSTYNIVREGEDRELRLFDRGNQPGGFAFEIFHSRGAFVPVSGGEYEALPGEDDGIFVYRAATGGLLFRDDPDVSTVEDTPIVFDESVPTLAVRLNGNGQNGCCNDLRLDIDRLRFDVTPTIPGQLVEKSMPYFREEPNYEDPNLVGFTTYALRVDALFEWSQAELVVDLDAGSMNRLFPDVQFADAAGPGDTAIFGPTEIVGDLSTRNTQFVTLDFFESDQFFSANWSAIGINDLGTFDIGMLTLSEDASGTITTRSDFLNEVVESTFQIVNGQIVPEPSSETLVSLLALMLTLFFRAMENGC